MKALHRKVPAIFCEQLHADEFCINLFKMKEKERLLDESHDIR